MRRCRNIGRVVRVRVVLAAAALLAVGCEPKLQPPIGAPAARLEASSTGGSLLEPSPRAFPATGPTTMSTTGPATQSAGGTSADRRTVGLDITWAVVDRLPADALDPLDARATLTSAPLANGAVLTTGRQTALARFGDGAAVDNLLRRVIARTDGPAAEAGHQAGVVAPGTTTTFRFTTGSAGRSVGLSFYLPTEAPSPATPTATPPAKTVSMTTEPATNPAPDTPAAATQSAAVTQPARTQRPTTRPTTQPAPAVMDSDMIGLAPRSAPAATGSITVTLQGFVDTTAPDADAGPATRPAITTTPETAYLADLPMSPGSRFAIALPCRFEGLPWQGLVAFIEVTESPADAAAVLDAQFGRPPATGPATLPAVQLTLRRAIDALRTGGDARPPLLFLTTATRANIAADAVLVASGPMLGKLREQVLQFTTAHDAADAAALGWFLDKSTVLAMSGDAAQNMLAPELAAVLVLHAGEVGRHADAMAEAVNSVGSAADLLARLIGENTIALEDNSPAARVRAFDWLKGQGRAPEGYDPLGDAKSRRDAINRAISNTQGTR